MKDAKEGGYTGAGRVFQSSREKDELVRILINSCMRNVGRTQVKQNRKSCSGKPLKERRHAVSMTRRAVSMKRAVENRKRCNIIVIREAEDGQLKRKRRNSFDFDLPKRPV